jgi:hypothetical protein
MQSTDQLLLKVGAPVGVPASGNKALFADTDGLVKTIDSVGAKTIVSGDAWAGAQQSLMITNVSQLTRFVSIPLGTNQAAFNAGLSDPALEGGGVSNASGGAVFMSQASLFQTMKTGKWALAIREKCAAPAGGQQSQIGTCNTGDTHHVAVGTDNAVSTTNFVLKILGAGSTNVVLSLAADTNLHDFVLTFDSTTLKVFIDGTQVGSTTTTTNLVDEPQFLYSLGTASGRVSATKCLYGFIDP